jgi:hypothetical protein
MNDTRHRGARTDRLLEMERVMGIEPERVVRLHPPDQSLTVSDDLACD